MSENEFKEGDYLYSHRVGVPGVVGVFTGKIDAGRLVIRSLVRREKKYIHSTDCRKVPHEEAIKIAQRLREQEDDD